MIDFTVSYSSIDPEDSSPASDCHLLEFKATPIHYAGDCQASQRQIDLALISTYWKLLESHPERYLDIAVGSLSIKTILAGASSPLAFFSDGAYLDQISGYCNR